MPRTSTLTVPCSIPVGMTRGKMRVTSSGLASVAMSQSLTVLPSRRSRTHPPTIQPRLPDSRNRSQMPMASRSMRVTRVSRLGAELTRALFGPGIHDLASPERRGCGRRGLGGGVGGGGLAARGSRAVLGRGRTDQLDLDLVLQAVEDQGLGAISIASHLDVDLLSDGNVEVERRGAEVLSVLEHVRV